MSSTVMGTIIIPDGRNGSTSTKQVLYGESMHCKSYGSSRLSSCADRELYIQTSLPYSNSYYLRINLKKSIKMSLTNLSLQSMNLQPNITSYHVCMEDGGGGNG